MNIMLDSLSEIFRAAYYSFSVSVCLLSLFVTAFGQDDDLIHVNTSLIQTRVSVFDKQGRFIDGLLPDQFELRIDGKLKPISFFERVVTGSEKRDNNFPTPMTPKATDRLRI